MADDRHYVPGSFYRICDQTGFKVRAERTRKQWNNLIVRLPSFEERNAQDFVRGRRDNQIVPDPRPRQNNVFLRGNTTLVQTALIRSIGIFLTAPIGLVAGNVVAILLDNGINFFVSVLSFGGDFSPDFSSDFSMANLLVLAQPLPFAASSGNAVVNTDYVAIQAQNLLPIGGS